MALVLLMVVVVVRVMPGDVIDAATQDQDRLNTVDRAALEHRLGLDKPLHEQYADYAWGLLRGSLGKSLWTDRPVREMLQDRVPVTLELMAFSMILALVVSLPVGVLSAVYRGSLWDVGLRSFASVGLSVPEFMTATVVLVVPAIWFQWSPALYVSQDAGLLDHFRSLLVPAAIVGWRLASSQARLIRTMMVEVLNQDYVRTARAKGLSERRVVVVHAMRNALLPVVTLLSLEVVSLLSGIVIIEMIFGIRGVGGLLAEAVQNRDYATVQGITVVLALMVVVVNIVTDLSYGVLDPRVRAGR